MVDYFSFEDVMKELELSEEDLKRMVSEGELRAFRDENKMKFKKEDVDNLKKGRITEPTIILPSTPGGKDETVLDLDIADVPKSKPKAPAASETDDLLVQPSDEKPIPEETLIEEETDSGLTTEPLKLADEITGADTVEGQAITAETEALAPPKSKRTGVRRRATAAVSVAQETEIEKRRPNPIWTALMVASFVVAVYSCLFVYELTRVEGNKQARPSGLTAGMADWTLKQFWGDANWRAMQNKKFEGQKGPRPTGVSDKISYPKDDWYGKPSFMKPIQAPPPQVQTQ